MKIFKYKEIDSTNLEAKRLIDFNIIEPTLNNSAIISAELQTHGRGRLERKWESLQGNMMFSLVFPLQWAKSSLLPACVCIAIRSTITPNDTTYFKWPNDVIINDAGTPKKCCGVLIEMHREFYIVGIGVNVLHHPKLTIYEATNLQQHQISIQNEEIIFQNLRLLLQKNSQDIMKLWNERNFFLGKAVKIGEVNGIFQSVDNHFNAILDCNGTRIAMPFGDIS